MENYIYQHFVWEAKGRLNPESPQYKEPYYHDKVVTDIFQIPDGVTDLEKYCLRFSEIGILILPDSLKTIGTCGPFIKSDKTCVLANCKIGTVVLPVDLVMLGDFAFGGCEIENLHIYGKCLYSPYARQIKDTHVKNLVIHSQGYDKDVKASGVYRSIMVNAKVENLIIL